eukprot:PLAT8569.1.p1 GENE.PLAT8569.1~~PLAT8569.1.p1  ORF type:complete len:220 (+),score=46.81 PLAT8569.1:83-742(+)
MARKEFKLRASRAGALAVGGFFFLASFIQMVVLMRSTASRLTLVGPAAMLVVGVLLPLLMTDVHVFIDDSARTLTVLKLPLIGCGVQQRTDFPVDTLNGARLLVIRRKSVRYEPILQFVDKPDLHLTYCLTSMHLRQKKEFCEGINAELARLGIATAVSEPVAVMMGAARLSSSLLPPEAVRSADGAEPVAVQVDVDDAAAADLQQNDGLPSVPLDMGL